MPLYEYECGACGHRFERIQNKFSDPLVKVCPACGGEVHKLMSSPAVQFKGSGWYVTDYARKDTDTKDKSTKDSGDTEKQEKKEKTETAEKAESAEKAAPKETKETKDTTSTKESTPGATVKGTTKEP